MTRDEFEAKVVELWVTTAIPMTRANLQYQTGESSKKLRKWLEELMVDGVLTATATTDGDLEWQVPGAKRPADGPRTFDERDRLQRLRDEVAADLAVKQATAAARAQALAAKREQLALAAGAAKSPPAAVKPDALARIDPERGLAEVEDQDRPGFFDRLRRRFTAADAIEIASEARRELDHPREKKQKSLLWSGGLSLVLGPIGWLYAGSFREAVPAGAIYLAIATVIMRMPLLSGIMLPVLGVALPVSGLAGLVYAWQYNREGKRGRLFGKDKKQKKKLNS